MQPRSETSLSLPVDSFVVCVADHGGLLLGGWLGDMKNMAQCFVNWASCVKRFCGVSVQTNLVSPSMPARRNKSQLAACAQAGFLEHKEDTRQT